MKTHIRNLAAVAFVSASMLAAPTASAGTVSGYLIMDGEGATQILIPDSIGSMNVSPGMNPHNYAAGTLSEFNDKDGMHYAFHGTLFGQPDPKPGGFGWGRTTFVQDVDSVARDFAGISFLLDMNANHVAGGELFCPPGLLDGYENADTLIAAIVAKVNASSIPQSRKDEHIAAANAFKSSLAGIINTINSFFDNPPQTPEELARLIKQFKKFKKQHKKAKKRLRFLLKELILCDLIIEVLPA